MKIIKSDNRVVDFKSLFFHKLLMTPEEGNFVRGIAFESRRRMIESRFGREAFAEYMRSLSERDPFWKQNILATSKIPLDNFLAFNDGLLARFYHNDIMAYWEWGRMAARWVLTEGPYRNFMKEKDLKTFISRVLPMLWRLYFTFGSADLKIRGRRVRITLSGLPRKHPYLEYTIMGWIEEAMLVKGEKIDDIRPISSGPPEVVYEFVLSRNVD